MTKFYLYITMFAIGFGYIEASVVVYLRALYYPDGFNLMLLSTKPPAMLAVEIVREAATLLVLLSVAMLSVRRPLHRFAVFAFCFGVWDIIYYVMLKIHLNWPASLLDWDILFLIPFPWIAPVLAPVLVSVSLIIAAIMLLRLDDNEPSPFNLYDWLIEIIAGTIILVTFFLPLPALTAGQDPVYSWWLFAIAYLGGFGWFGYRWMGRHQQNTSND